MNMIGQSLEHLGLVMAPLMLLSRVRIPADHKNIVTLPKGFWRVVGSIQTSDHCMVRRNASTDTEVRILK